MNPVLSRITIYPIKSLDGHSLQKAIISDGGCLLHDREYAISDAEGNLLIGKSIHLCTPYDQLYILKQARFPSDQIKIYPGSTFILKRKK